eukprot:374713-Hanusia_phi.AAC.2
MGGQQSSQSKSRTPGLAGTCVESRKKKETAKSKVGGLTSVTSLHASSSVQANSVQHRAFDGKRNVLAPSVSKSKIRRPPSPFTDVSQQSRGGLRISMVWTAEGVGGGVEEDEEEEHDMAEGGGHGVVVSGCDENDQEVVEEGRRMNRRSLMRERVFFLIFTTPVEDCPRRTAGALRNILLPGCPPKVCNRVQPPSEAQTVSPR